MANEKIDNLSFEAAYTQLEEIVQQLESSGLSLDDGLDLFEKGQELAAYCQKLLEAAELRVSQLTSAGDIVPLDE